MQLGQLEKSETGLAKEGGTGQEWKLTLGARLGADCVQELWGHHGNREPCIFSWECAGLTG